MNTIKDGGPAFPCEQHETQNGEWNQTFELGMSLRDYFAAKALSAQLSLEKTHIAIGNNKITKDDISGACYEWADSMLKARMK